MMAYRVFTLPVRDPGASETELNGFLASHRVLSVDRRFVEDGERSFWSFCVDFVDARGGSSSSSAAGGTSWGSDLIPSFSSRSADEYVRMEGMPRRLRLQYPGAISHLIARGNGRQDIVCDDVDRDRLQEHFGRSATRC